MLIPEVFREKRFARKESITVRNNDTIVVLVKVVWKLFWLKLIGMPDDYETLYSHSDYSDSSIWTRLLELLEWKKLSSQISSWPTTTLIDDTTCEHAETFVKKGKKRANGKKKARCFAALILCAKSWLVAVPQKPRIIETDIELLEDPSLNRSQNPLSTTKIEETSHSMRGHG